MNTDPICTDCGNLFEHGEELGDECHHCRCVRDAAHELKMLAKWKTDAERRFDRSGDIRDDDAAEHFSERIASYTEAASVAFPGAR